MQSTQYLLLYFLVSVSAIVSLKCVVNALYVEDNNPATRHGADLATAATSHTSLHWTPEDVAPTSASMEDTINTSPIYPLHGVTSQTFQKHKKINLATVSKTTIRQGQEISIPSEYTTITLPSFDCRIIPTTETVTFSKTRAGQLVATAIYETQTKTPTVTNTVFTSCSPECTSVFPPDVTETITTAIFTQLEVAMGCDAPPLVFTDTLTLFTIETLAVRNTDTVTITVTPEEKVTYLTNTYYVNTYANEVVENEYFQCDSPPPCKNFEATTITETLTIETTTSISSLCLDNWEFYLETTTLTDYSCFNPFSIYACPNEGSCPLPITITETRAEALETIILTESPPCYWQRPPVLSQDSSTVTVTLGQECWAGTPETTSPETTTPETLTPGSTKPKTTIPDTSSPETTTEFHRENDSEIKRLVKEVKFLVKNLIEDLLFLYPRDHIKVNVHSELLDRLDKAKNQPGLNKLTPADLRRYVMQQRLMIAGLRKYATDTERVKANPKLFFDRLVALVEVLEKQSGDFQGA